jgi:hypothetical protein
MRFTTLLRLAYPGSLTDRVRVAITIVGAALAGLSVLATGTVLNMAPTERRFEVTGGWGMDPYDWRYTSTLLNESGLRPGLIAMVAATVLPALVLLAQAARLGGPARDHRLAMLRLAGTTPRQARAIAAAAQTFTVAIGALLATTVYPLARWLLNRPTMNGVRVGGAVDIDGGYETHQYTGLLLPLPTDTWPTWWSWIAVLVALPVLAGLVSMVSLRRLINSPLAASRRVRRERPRIWPIWLIAVGLVDMAVCREWIDALARAGRPGSDLVAPYVTLVAGLAATCVGVPLCAAGVGYLGARITLRYAHRPATLIAARRVLADPYAGSRAVSALLVCTVLVGALVGIRTQMDFQIEVMAITANSIPDPDLYELVMDILYGLSVTFIGFAAVGLLIALVDAAMSRRRTEAALMAAGTSTPVLVTARVIGVFLVAVPGVLLGLATGFASPSLAMPPQKAPAAVEHICHDLAKADTVVPCTDAGLAQQKSADAAGGSPAYSFVEYQAQGPWRIVHPAIPWGRLATAGGVALLAVVLVTILSLAVGRRSPAETALRTT